ncbi:MAG TPA: hypothetical protein VGI46_14565 [Candidatus Acidoferrum sp.]|jgi:hypothetical protein
MTKTGDAEVALAVVAGGFELASPETRAKEQTNKKIRNDGRIRCTVTRSYISKDERSKNKVAQIKRKKR